MRTLIVDDEAMSRKSLERLCGKIEALEVVASCENGIEALNLLKKESIDLVFLDIEMPDLTGIDLVKSGVELPQIVFTTSRKDYAVEAFEYNVTDYITKPVALPRLMQSVERALEVHVAKMQKGSTTDDIYIKVESRYVRLPFDDILYVETMGDYVTFQTVTERFIVHSTLKSIDERLQDARFLKVHRSFIVNLSKIVDIEDSTLLIGSKVIPISRANRPTLMARINML